MPAYLKIENIGVCPAEGFTVLGVSLADTSANQGVIGQFGSGNKHGVAVCLRNEIAPVVFCGTLRLEFFTKPQTVADSQASKDFARVCVKYGGVDPATGANRSATEDLGFVLDYGKQDWNEIALALREFVSNAIDRSIREWGDWSGVKIEIVDDNQVRAKRGHTRVFVPLTPEVLGFYNNLGKWFLHFSEPESLKKAILPKKNRNLGERRAAVIYRRGVRVREFESSDMESLFDYNLDSLTIDEARKASDWDVRHHCGQALANADKDVLAILFSHLLNSSKPVWEFTFDTYSLQPSYGDNAEEEERKRRAWQDAFAQVAGDVAVLSGEGTVKQLEGKGYKPVQAPEGIVNAAARYGVQTPASVLSADEMSGREITEPTDSAQAAVDFVWELVQSCGLNNNKDKPPAKCFSSILDAGVMLNGYYRDGTVFINGDLSPAGVADVGRLSERPFLRRRVPLHVHRPSGWRHRRVLPGRHQRDPGGLPQRGIRWRDRRRQLLAQHRRGRRSHPGWPDAIQLHAAGLGQPSGQASHRGPILHLRGSRSKRRRGTDPGGVGRVCAGQPAQPQLPFPSHGKGSCLLLARQATARPSMQCRIEGYNARLSHGRRRRCPPLGGFIRRSGVRLAKSCAAPSEVGPDLT